MAGATCCKKVKLCALRGTDITWKRGQLLPIPKLLLMIIFCLNGFLAQSVFVGWPSILKVYKEEGYYSNYCLNSTLSSNLTTSAFNLTVSSLNGTAFSCLAQDDRFNTVYTVAASCSFFGSMVFGFILDIFGPKVSGTISNCFILLGVIFLTLYQCRVPLY
jgi:hypothetical protein